jgi:predicted acylesterase/phospholipase RssA
VDCFGGPVVPIRRCDLAINAVDARTNSVVRFVTRGTERTQGSEYVVTEHITVDMVLASTSIPILFPSIPVGRRLLWDGGVLSNTPLAPAVAMGADHVVIVLVNHNDELAHPRLENLGQALERLVDMLLENAYNVDRQLLLSRNRIAQLEAERAKDGTAYREVRLYQAIRPARDAAFDAGSLIDFDRARLRHLYAHGQSAAAAWLQSGPPVDGPRAPTVAHSTDREQVASLREATA